MSEKMNDDFFGWLDECPVEWQLVNSDDNSMEYTFMVTEIIGGKCEICCCDITDKHSLIMCAKRWGLCDNCYDDQVFAPE